MKTVSSLGEASKIIKRAQRKEQIRIHADDIVAAFVFGPAVLGVFAGLWAMPIPRWLKVQLGGFATTGVILGIAWLEDEVLSKTRQEKREALETEAA